MQFNHDNMTGPLLAADLVSLIGTGWSATEVSLVLETHHIRRRALTDATTDALRTWSTRLRSAFDATDVEGRCTAINLLLDEGAARPSLSTHDDLAPHLHFASDSDDVVARVKAVTSGGLALFTVESRGTRLGICRRVGCEIAFVDASRNGLRAYCSARCGNYDAVRRHRGTTLP